MGSTNSISVLSICLLRHILKDLQSRGYLNEYGGETIRGRWPAAYLLAIKHWENESLKAYPSRLNNEHMATDDLDKKIKLVALVDGI